MALNKQFTFSTFLSNNKSSVQPTFFINPPIKSIDSFIISSFTGVNNCYTFDSRNNNILVQETGEVAFLAIIPTGNYTITTLLSTLSTILTNGSPSLSTYVATKSDLTNIITITSSNKTFTITDTVNNAYYEIGFLNINSTAALSQVTSNQFDLSGVKTIHVVSNGLGNDGSILVNSNYNVLCSIPIDVPYLGVIGFEKKSDLLINCKVNELSSITFTLYDERYRPINMTSDWSLQLICNFE